jgi:PqqD family protein of HPr-rel-A system
LALEARTVLRLAPGVRLKWFDAELLAFNPASWETHLINAAGSGVVDALSRGPDSVEQLLDAYRQAHPELPARACDQALTPLLEDLVELGLVLPTEPATS